MEPIHYCDAELFAESPAEKLLYRCLYNIYKGYYKPQVAIGRYRVDALSRDGIAWEVDGINYHDRSKDILRDEALLKSGDIDEIIRIPASVIFYYELATEFGLRESLGIDACDIIGVSHATEVNRWADEAIGNGNIRETLEGLTVGQSYLIRGDIILIGKPIAFLRRTHRLWDCITHNKQSLCSWIGTIERRTLANRRDWMTVETPGVYYLGAHI